MQISRSDFGEVQSVDLVPGGATIPVTTENRHQYMDAYEKYMMTEAVRKPFDAFERGSAMVAFWYVLWSNLRTLRGREGGRRQGGRREERREGGRREGGEEGGKEAGREEAGRKGGREVGGREGRREGRRQGVREGEGRREKRRGREETVRLAMEVRSPIVIIL